MDDCKHYRFISHTQCEYFPCHADADPEQFNCLFCYCPLYALDADCGGNFTYTQDGIKDCSSCLLPHEPQGYDRIQSYWPKIVSLMKARRTGTSDSSSVDKSE